MKHPFEAEDNRSGIDGTGITQRLAAGLSKNKLAVGQRQEGDPSAIVDKFRKENCDPKLYPQTRAEPASAEAIADAELRMQTMAETANMCTAILAGEVTEEDIEDIPDEE